MASEQVQQYRDVLDIVFTDRNKAYGAYELRRRYPRHVRNAMLITLLLATGLIAYPYIKGIISPYIERAEEEKKVVTLENLPAPRL
ncbi:MAG: hypothetical protein IPL33_19520 [Sphingobacteriales bacterium]|nr:hypothetical protein [Sphingobacteriales bacterium]